MTTTATDFVLTDFLAPLSPVLQQDCLTLCQLLQQLTQSEPRLWAGKMVGFGQYHYRYASGREGDAFLLGFAVSKTGLTLYVGCEIPTDPAWLAQLGKAKLGKSCLYLKKLADVDLAVLTPLLQANCRHLQQLYPQST